MSLKFNNNNFLKISTLTVFILMQCFSNGSARKCFVCDSSDNPSCAKIRTNDSIVAEECTLDKMKSIDTWLFELNKIAYFDMGVHKSPLMTCQKVVARDPNTKQMVTARFCQLDTGATNACAILRTKLGLPAEKAKSAENNNNNNNNNERRESEQQQNDSDEFHCSICNWDKCNGAASMHRSITMTLVGGGCLLTALMIVHVQQMILRLW